MSKLKQKSVTYCNYFFNLKGFLAGHQKNTPRQCPGYYQLMLNSKSQQAAHFSNQPTGLIAWRNESSSNAKQIQKKAL
jgi:hypothetical protein